MAFKEIDYPQKEISFKTKSIIIREEMLLIRYNIESNQLHVHVFWYKLLWFKSVFVWGGIREPHK